MRSKDTEFAAVKLPRCLVGGVKEECGNKHRHTYLEPTKKSMHVV